MTKTSLRARGRDNADGAPPAGDHFHSAQLGRLLGAEALPEAIAAPPGAEGLPAASLVVYNAIVRDYVISTDGLTAYVVGLDGTVRAYNAETGTLVQSWAITTSPGGLAISPDGGFLALVERDPLSVTGSQHDAQTTVVTHRIDLATGAVTSFQFVATGFDHAFNDVEILADGRAYFTQSLSGSGATRVWALDYSTGQYTAILNGERFFSPFLAVVDSGLQLLISAGNSSFAGQTLVDIRSGTPVTVGTANPQGPSVGILAVSDAAGLIVMFSGGNILLYDTDLNFIQNLSLIQPIFANMGGFSAITALAFDVAGDFLYAVNNDTETIVQLSTDDWSVVQSFDLPDGSFTFGAGIGNELLLGPDARYFLLPAGGQLLRIDNPTVPDAIAGTPGIDALTGTAGNDVIIGYQSADVMTGLAGDDRYHVDNAGDIVVEAAGGGTDIVTTSASYVLAANSEIERLQTSNALGTGAIDLTGNALDNQLTGNSGNNRLDGGEGADIASGGKGNDSYFVDNQGDSTLEAAGQGTDIVWTSISYALGAGQHIEALAAANAAATDPLHLTGNELGQTITGNSGANLIDGGGGNDTLIGGGAADTLIGGSGNDAYRVEEAGDSVVEAAGGGFDAVYAVVSYALAAGSEVELLSAIDPASTAGMNLTGNEYANILIGTAGGNTLIGGGAADTLIGGAGNDVYRVEEAGDVVVEAVGGGSDSVYAVVSYALGAGSEVELLSAIDPASSAAMNLTGNEFVNLIIGTAGANTLIGGGGADTLIGGAGNDSYRVEEAGDLVVEAIGAGFDAIYAVGSYALAAGSEIELLSAIAPAAAVAMNLTGNEFANILIGTAGGNTLIGGGGADTLIGGAGNDVYRVEEAGDVVVEAAGGGFDAVYAVASYTLGAGSEVELLSAIDPASTAGMNLTGNEYANLIYGNAAANTLIGGGGADVLIGGAGGDFYRVEEAGDVVVEAVGGGADSVYAVTSYALAAGSEVELLSAIDPGSTAAMDLTGNEFANSIYGNAAGNTLIGGGGADRLVGGAGNDVYRVEEAGDIVVEAAGGGADSVYAVTSYALAAGSEVELLAAIDPGSTAAINLTGNEFVNRIYGNAAANTLNGGLGGDVLYGLGGADNFLFDTAPGVNNWDGIADFVTGTDKILLDDAVFVGIGPLGPLGAGAFTTGGFDEADDRIRYLVGTGQIFFDPDGNGPANSVIFLSVLPGDALNYLDFVVV